MNYFQLFDLPVAFRTDQALLAQRYFDIQKSTHPDFFARATEAEQEEALERSAAANKGYRVLKNPDETIKYVLELKGVLEADEKYQLPPGFLMEMMELNEEEETAARKRVAELENELYTAIAPVLDSYRDGATDTAALEPVKAYYFKKKYLQRILDRFAG